MIGKVLYGACAIAFVAATAVLAEPANNNEAKSDPNRQICHTTADTGTRLGRTRECHTAQEWEEIRRRTGDAVDQQRDRH